MNSKKPREAGISEIYRGELAMLSDASSEDQIMCCGPTWEASMEGAKQA